MKEWFAGLDARERQALIGGGAALALLLIWLLGWQPLTGAVARLENSVAERRAQLQTMQTAAAEVQRLRAANRGAGAASGQSLLAVVDQTARQAQLGGALKRVEPEGQNSVRVWFEEASFDDVVRWLGTLQQQTGAQVSRLTIDRPGAPGRVNARLVIEGAK